jgi:hypothetical protein
VTRSGLKSHPSNYIRNGGFESTFKSTSANWAISNNPSGISDVDMVGAYTISKPFAYEGSYYLTIHDSMAVPGQNVSLCVSQEVTLDAGTYNLGLAVGLATPTAGHRRNIFWQTFLGTTRIGEGAVCDPYIPESCTANNRAGKPAYTLENVRFNTTVIGFGTHTLFICARSDKPIQSADQTLFDAISLQRVSA